MLAIASSFARTGNASDGGYTFLITLLFVTIMFMVIKPVVARVHHKFASLGAVADSSIFASLLFLMLLLASFTTEVIGTTFLSLEAM
jgi:Kef-type K+ transport system membrane component KefB